MAEASREQLLADIKRLAYTNRVSVAHTDISQHQQGYRLLRLDHQMRCGHIQCAQERGSSSLQRVC
jgi:hypothetical protein